MSRVEVEESELDALRRVTNVVSTVMKHPEAAKLTERALKLVNPNAKTPHLDMEAQLAAPVDAMQKQFDDYKKEQTEKEEKRENDAKLAALNTSVEEGYGRLRRAGWTDAGIDGVKKTMEERGIIDVDIAAAYYEKQHPPQSPLTPGGSGAWNFMEMPDSTDVDLKRLVETKGESAALVDKMANDALNEVRGSQRR